MKGHMHMFHIALGVELRPVMFVLIQTKKTTDLVVVVI